MIIIIKTILVQIDGYIGRYSKFDKSVNCAKLLRPVAFIACLIVSVSIVTRQEKRAGHEDFRQRVGWWVDRLSLIHI